MSYDKGQNDDLLKEFGLIKDEIGDSSEKIEDLSKTMVVPRVEDLIEERPLQPATDAESFLAATAAEEEHVVGRRASRAQAEPERRHARPAEKTGGDEMKEKKAKKPKKKKTFGKVLLTIILILIGLGIIACGVVAYYVYNIVKDAPKIYPDNIYELLSENSIVYDRNGVVIDNIFQGDSLRTNVEYNEMPKQLVDAFVSIEDKTFWEHHGFNFIRIAGAVWQKVSGQSDRIGGTSTITQQLARNLYLSEIKSQRSMSRKIIEAYYTIQIEKQLTKEQIVEAYLNTIYLGYNCNGVAAAAQAYFSKDVSELTLLECAQLAALPQSPDSYAPLKRYSISSVSDPDSLDIIAKDEYYIVCYNDASANRIKTVLRFMNEQGKIDDATYASAKEESIRDYLNPGSSAINNVTTSYFVDYVKEQVLADLKAAGYDSDTAKKLLYSGGLHINTTMDVAVQEILDTEYDNPENFPGISIQYSDKNGNILNEDRNKILLYKMANFFNENGDFVLGSDEYKFLDNGDLMVYSGKRLNVYRTSVGGNIDYSVEFKYLYEVTEDKVFYSRAGGVWSIDAKYKDRDDNMNLILSKQYFEDFPNAFTKNDNGTLTLSKDYFTLKQRVRQPQSAMVIMDYENGHILGMVGGRDLTGKALYNRVTSVRQPGSSIKPIALYSLALQMGKNGSVGYTAAMPLDDAPILNNNSIWPKNWYTGYNGITNLRHAVEQSINACAVNLYMKIGDPYASINQLQKMGITSLVTTGDATDANASSLALGGMVNGISPLEMTAAYGTIGNHGTYTEPICYTTVTTKSGDIILSKEASHTRVLDEDVASLMTDILRTTVTNGLGSKAKLSSQPSAGKTGTTTERYDIWFCGITPQYAAATWIGSDVNIPVSSDSSYAAKLWAKVMDQVGALVPREEFEMRGEFVTETVNNYTGGASEYSTGDDTHSEIFIKGTEPSLVGTDETIGYHTATVCAESGYLATPWCPSSYTTVGIVRPGGVSWEKMLDSYKTAIAQAIENGVVVKDQNLDSYTVGTVKDSSKDLPDLYCPYHNYDTETYPVSSTYTVHESVDIEGDIIDTDPEDLLNPEVIEDHVQRIVEHFFHRD